MDTRKKIGNKRPSKPRPNSPSNPKIGGKGDSGSSRQNTPDFIMVNPPLRSERTGRWT